MFNGEFALVESLETSLVNEVYSFVNLIKEELTGYNFHQTCIFCMLLLTHQEYMLRCYVDLVDINGTEILHDDSVLTSCLFISLYRTHQSDTLLCPSKGATERRNNRLSKKKEKDDIRSFRVKMNRGIEEGLYHRSVMWFCHFNQRFIWFSL